MGYQIVVNNEFHTTLKGEVFSASFECLDHPDYSLFKLSYSVFTVYSITQIEGTEFTFQLVQPNSDPNIHGVNCDLYSFIIVE